MYLIQGLVFLRCVKLYSSEFVITTKQIPSPLAQNSCDVYQHSNHIFAQGPLLAKNSHYSKYLNNHFAYLEDANGDCSANRLASYNPLMLLTCYLFSF